MDPGEAELAQGPSEQTQTPQDKCMQLKLIPQRKEFSLEFKPETVSCQISRRDEELGKFAHPLPSFVPNLEDKEGLRKG